MSAPPDPLPQVVVAENEKSQAPILHSRSASGESGDDKAKTEAETNSSPEEEKSRRKWWNPLRWQTPPPVPDERTPSKEYGASFFSIISFQWMSPLMRVSSFNPPNKNRRS